ncbi:unnamed protein product [Mytilus coruscus]|uniref:DDE Tnp4 domain-containing protein n=1 Tax=Mytilus coruscus TaxID=42192 RepID=A0A6J8CM71_MYTCO|nr:unnamed protein product [Mytilus coruscus]
MIPSRLSRPLSQDGKYCMLRWVIATTAAEGRVGRDEPRMVEKIFPRTFALEKISVKVGKRDGHPHPSDSEVIQVISSSFSHPFNRDGEMLQDQPWRYPALQCKFREAHNTISILVPDVCRAIREVYKTEVILCPTTMEGRRPIAEEFKNKWNVHVALSNANMLPLDINDSELKKCLQGSIAFPKPEPLPFDDSDMPYLVLGDDAFGLHTFLMNPYSERGLTKGQCIYNYRMSRGRRVVGNAFVILVQRFQVRLTAIQIRPDNIRDVILCVST